MTRSLPWRTLFHFTIAAVAALSFALLADQVVAGRVDAIDRAWALAIHRLDDRALDYAMVALTVIGSGPVRMLAIVLMTIWLWRRHHRRIELILAANALVAYMLEVALKHVFGRPRPTLWEAITRPDTFSFPSGHALSAMAVYGGLAAVLVTLRPTRKRVVITGAAFLICGIGFSRIYLGVHWPFDVIAGFVAGVPLVVATVHLLHTRSGPKTGRQRSQVNVYSPA
jgi:membrane-associated phospholipid phosphatase